MPRNEAFDSINGQYTVASGTGADIQSAIDKANADGGGTVRLGPNEFTVSATIEKPARVRLVGAGEQETYLSLADGANVDVIHCVPDGHYDGNSGLGALSIDGNKANNTSGRGIAVTPLSLRLHFDQVEVTNMPGDGIVYEPPPTGSDNTYEPIVTNSGVTDCGGNGVVTNNGVVDLWAANLTSQRNGGDGYLIQQGGGHSLIHPHAVENAGDGIVLDNTSQNWLYDPYGDTNDGHGIVLRNGTSQCLLVGGFTMKNGVDGAQKDGIYLTDAYINKIIGISCDDPRSATDTTQRYGIHEDQASGNYIGYCDVGGNDAGPFEGSRSTEIKHCDGITTEVTGVDTFTGDGTTDKYIIYDKPLKDLYLPVTDPDTVNIQVTGANYDDTLPVPVGANPVYDGNGDPVNIRVVFSSAPGDGVDIRTRWSAEIAE